MSENINFTENNLSAILIISITSLLLIIEVLILFNPNIQITDFLAVLNLFILVIIKNKKKSWIEGHQNKIHILSLLIGIVIMMRYVIISN